MRAAVSLCASRCEPTLFPEAEVEAEAEAEAEAEEEAEAEAEAEAEEVEAVEFWHRFEDVEGFSRIGCSITKGKALYR